MYDYNLQNWVPYVPDPDKWYQYALDLRKCNVQHHNQGHYNVSDGAKHGQLKEKEALQNAIEKQRPVVNLVSPVAQVMEMTKSTVKRESEMAKSKTFVPPGRR